MLDRNLKNVKLKPPCGHNDEKSLKFFDIFTLYDVNIILYYYFYKRLW